MTLFYRWLRAVSLGTRPHPVIGSRIQLERETTQTTNSPAVCALVIMLSVVVRIPSLEG